MLEKRVRLQQMKERLQLYSYFDADPLRCLSQFSVICHGRRFHRLGPERLAVSRQRKRYDLERKRKEAPIRHNVVNIIYLMSV